MYQKHDSMKTVLELAGKSGICCRVDSDGLAGVIVEVFSVLGELYGGVVEADRVPPAAHTGRTHRTHQRRPPQAHFEGRHRTHQSSK